MFDTILAMSIGILHDCFGFGHERIGRFMEKFNEGANLVVKGVLTWEQVIENTEEVVGHKINVRRNDTNTRLKRIY